MRGSEAEASDPKRARRKERKLFWSLAEVRIQWRETSLDAGTLTRRGVCTSLCKDLSMIVGAYDGEAPPVPIPNTVVKLLSADNTWLVTAREYKSVPTHKRNGAAWWLRRFFLLLFESLTSSSTDKNAMNMALNAKRAQIKRRIRSARPVPKSSASSKDF